MLNLYQERDFGSKINATFQFITQDLRSYVLSILFIAGPPALFIVTSYGYLVSFLSSIRSNPNQTIDPSLIYTALPALLFAMFAFLIAILMVGLVTFSQMKLYNPSANGRLASPGQVWREVRQHIFRALAFVILSTIVVQVASIIFVALLATLSSYFLILFYVISVYFNVVFVLGLPIIVFEDASFGDVWGRCFTLMRGKWFSTFALVVIMTVIAVILCTGLQLPVLILGLLGVNLMKYAAVSTALAAIVILSALIMIGLYYTAIGFQYTSIIERQEGRGLMSAIDGIGTAPTKPRLDDEGDY